MISADCENPSLTFIALTARAVDHALEEMKKGNLKGAREEIASGPHACRQRLMEAGGG
jgi:hypothetical protein